MIDSDYAGEKRTKTVQNLPKPLKEYSPGAINFIDTGTLSLQISHQSARI